MSVKVYVEGGGDSSALKRKCREGFREFFRKIGLQGRMPRIVACGPRNNAYDDFCTASIRLFFPPKALIRFRMENTSRHYFRHGDDNSKIFVD